MKTFPRIFCTLHVPYFACSPAAAKTFAEPRSLYHSEKVLNFTVYMSNSFAPISSREIALHPSSLMESSTQLRVFGNRITSQQFLLVSVLTKISQHCRKHFSESRLIDCWSQPERMPLVRDIDIHLIERPQELLYP